MFLISSLFNLPDHLWRVLSGTGEMNADIALTAKGLYGLLCVRLFW